MNATKEKVPVELDTPSGTRENSQPEYTTRRIICQGLLAIAAVLGVALALWSFSQPWAGLFPALVMLLLPATLVSAGGVVVSWWTSCGGAG